MGGYNSGRKSSGGKNVEDYYTLDICWLYRNGLLEPGRKTVIRFGKSFAIRMRCKTRFWGWEQCLHIEYPVWNDAGKIETREQVIGFEWVSTLKGKTRRPYFYCPMLEIRAGKLLMGRNSFAHRRWYGPVYYTQTLGILIEPYILAVQSGTSWAVQQPSWLPIHLTGQKECTKRLTGST